MQVNSFVRNSNGAVEEVVGCTIGEIGEEPLERVDGQERTAAEHC